MEYNKKWILFQWIMLGIFFILIALLIQQNLKFKKLSKAQVEANRTYEYNAYCETLAFEDRLNNFLLYKLFPIDIQSTDFFNYETNKIEDVNGYIIIVFDLTVCGGCLNNELKLLHSYKNILRTKKILFLCIIGISSKSEESDILSRYRAGDISFPFKFINVDKLYDTFQLSRDKYIDTPFYIYTTQNFKIYNIFKSQYMDTRRLERWLEIIADQEMF